MSDAGRVYDKDIIAGPWTLIPAPAVGGYHQEECDNQAPNYFHVPGILLPLPKCGKAPAARAIGFYKTACLSPSAVIGNEL
jgi:hypothetical protein